MKRLTALFLAILMMLTLLCSSAVFARAEEAASQEELLDTYAKADVTLKDSNGNVYKPGEAVGELKDGDIVSFRIDFSPTSSNYVYVNNGAVIDCQHILREAYFQAYGSY